jgi:hypothetical protein
MNIEVGTVFTRHREVGWLTCQGGQDSDLDEVYFESMQFLLTAFRVARP